MKTVSALDVRRKFGQLLDEAAAGERIVIERAGIPLAALVPLADLAAADPGAVAGRQLAALAEVRRLVSEAPPAPAGWDAGVAVRADRDRNADEARPGGGPAIGARVADGPAAAEPKAGGAARTREGGASGPATRA